MDRLALHGGCNWEGCTECFPPARTPQWKMDAYAWISSTFGLKAKQRDALDVSEHYEALMLAGHAQDYGKVQDLLVKAGIISYKF